MPHPASRAPSASAAPQAESVRVSRDFTLEFGNDNLPECSMTESEFLALAERTLASIEARVEAAADAADIDIECGRSGNVLEIECVDNGSKIIVNSQSAMQEIWIAARSGGFHYRFQDGRWLDTRDGSELFAALSRALSEQAGVALQLAGG